MTSPYFCQAHTRFIYSCEQCVAITKAINADLRAARKDVRNGEPWAIEAARKFRALLGAHKKLQITLLDLTEELGINEVQLRAVREKLKNDGSLNEERTGGAIIYSLAQTESLESIKAELAATKTELDQAKAQIAELTEYFRSLHKPWEPQKQITKA